MKRQLLTLLIVPLLLLFFLTVPVEAQQTKKFHVNAYRLVANSDEEANLELLCQGFDVVISSNKINIGDEFDLAVVDNDYISEKALTIYTVEDPAKDLKVRFAIVGIDSDGNSFIQLHESDSEDKLVYEGGMFFAFKDIVPNYDLWRYMRNR